MTRASRYESDAAGHLHRGDAGGCRGVAELAVAIGAHRPEAAIRLEKQAEVRTG